MMRGKYLSKEHRKKLSESHKGHEHSKETKQKISKALKGHIGWWKEKQFSKEHKKKLSESHKDQIPWNKELTKFMDSRVAGYGKNGGESRKGKKLSEKHKQNISKARTGKRATEETKRNMSKVQKRIKKEMFASMTKARRREYCKFWIKAGHANPSSIEKIIQRILNGLSIEHEVQVSFNNRKFIVDIYIPAQRLIVECNGDYWHNYKLFPEKKIRDNALEKYAKNNNYKLVWLWESNIRRDPEAALTQGLKGIKQ